MASYINNNPPSVEENTERTLRRLEKANKKIESLTSSLKKAGFAIPVITGMAGLFAGGIELSGLATLAGIAVMIPVTTGAIAIPVVTKEILQQKMDFLKKKISKPLSSYLEKQEQKTKNSESYYQKVSANSESTVSDINFAKKELNNQKTKEQVYNVAAELAKKEGKEKTIGRLMRIVERAEKADITSSGFQAVMQGGMAAASLSLANVALQPISNALGYVAAISAAATVYCAAKTVDNIQKNKKAKKAYSLLKDYTQEQRQ